MEEYKKMWKNYAVFSGRSTRKDYWMAVLMNIIVSFVIGFLSGVVKMPILSGIYSLAVFIPGLSIMVRRFHDVNKSGCFWLMSLIPLVGWIIVLVTLCRGSVEEENRYGDIVE